MTMKTFLSRLFNHQISPSDESPSPRGEGEPSTDQPIILDEEYETVSDLPAELNPTEMSTLKAERDRLIRLYTGFNCMNWVLVTVIIITCVLCIQHPNTVSFVVFFIVVGSCAAVAIYLWKSQDKRLVRIEEIKGKIAALNFHPLTPV